MNQCLAALLVRVRSDDSGASLVEYALLVGLIAVVVAVAVTALGQSTSGSLSEAVSSIADARG